MHHRNELQLQVSHTLDAVCKTNKKHLHNIADCVGLYNNVMKIVLLFSTAVDYMDKCNPIPPSGG